MPGPGLRPDAGRRPRRPRQRQAAAHAGVVASQRYLHREHAAAVERHHSLVPLATQGIHHPVLPLAAVEHHHPVLPPHATTSRLTHLHAVVPLTAVERHHPVLPPHATFPGATHHHAVVKPLATFPWVTHHATLPDATLKLQHAILPLATARHADPVTPVTAVRLHNSSSNNNTYAAPSADVRGRARRAVRAAPELPRVAVASLHGVQAPVVLRPPHSHHAVAAHGGAPRLRPAAAPARPGDRDPLGTDSGREPRHRRAPSGRRRQAAVPTGVRRGVRVAAAAGEAVLVNHALAARSRCLAVAVAGV
jgi:hypothetical protein